MTLNELDQFFNGRSREVSEQTHTEKSIGNCAKLREALVQAELFVGNIVRHGHQTLVPGDKCTACDGAEELRGMICAALSSPPRNCDRFNSGDPVKDANDAYAEWQRWCDAADMPPSCKVESSFRQWLFATAKPNAKGATDGK